MKPGQILRLLAIPAVVAGMASCASTEPPVPSRSVAGASLDRPPETRYTPGATQSGVINTTTTPAIEDDLPDIGGSASTNPTPSTAGTSSSGTGSQPADSGASTVTQDVPKPQVTAPSDQPSYGSPVTGRPGFVYPPGVEQKPENMVDVRDFAPGQKVRDPRTGKIFLVP